MDAAKRAVLVGAALGDGHLNVRTRYRNGSPYVSAALRVLHGPSQRAYCEWKAKRVGWALGGRQINVTKVKNGPGGRYEAYQFAVSSPYFVQLKRWLYPGGKKYISRKVLDMLNPEALAIWYMDDGHARRNLNRDGYISSVSSSIATYCSEAEVDAILLWLAEEYGVEAKKRFDKGRPTCPWFVEMNTAATKEFTGVIASHVPECMLYKLAHVAGLTTQERQAPIGVCKECNEALYDSRRKWLCARCYTRAHRAMI